MNIQSEFQKWFSQYMIEENIIEDKKSTSNTSENSCKEYQNENNRLNISKQRCLITNDILEDDHIELYCGHKFNYDALIHDAYYSKLNTLKYKTAKYISCPYCRHITRGLLPQRDGYPIYNYVNDDDICKMKVNKCVYVKKNGVQCNIRTHDTYCKRCLLSVDRLKNKKVCCYVMKRGKNKGKTCSKYVSKCINAIYCSQHQLK